MTFSQIMFQQQQQQHMMPQMMPQMQQNPFGMMPGPMMMGGGPGMTGFQPDLTSMDRVPVTARLGAKQPNTRYKKVTVADKAEPSHGSILPDTLKTEALLCNICRIRT